MQQTIAIAKEPVHAKLMVPGSKNITYKALLLAALAQGVSEITNININEGTMALLNAFRQLGIVVQLDEKSRSCIIAGGNGKFPRKQETIWCDNNIILARFLLAACSAT